MSVLEVPLESSFPGAARALLRELSGREEALLAKPSSLLATELLGRLLLGVRGFSASSLDVWSLSVSDRDRLIAALYLSCYGDRIDATATCRACAQGFAFGCSLREVLESNRATLPDGVDGPDESGAYRLASGHRFRIPTTADERAAAELPEHTRARLLLARCVVDGELPVQEEAALEQALERLAPVLAFELPLKCPQCGAEQHVLFDISEFFVASLIRERPLLLREIHCLASSYHWSHADILNLPRSERREYVALVLAERMPELAEGLS